MSRAAASSPPVALADHRAARAAASCGELPVDLHRMRAVFPDRWQAFIKANFRDLQHIQFFFGVSERTAREWRDGVGSPRAEAALYAVSRFPHALTQLMGAA